MDRELKEYFFRQIREDSILYREVQSLMWDISKSTMEDIQKDYIVNALTKANGKLSGAARISKVDARTLKSKCRYMGIVPKDYKHKVKKC